MGCTLKRFCDWGLILARNSRNAQARIVKNTTIVLLCKNWSESTSILWD